MSSALVSGFLSPAPPGKFRSAHMLIKKKEHTQNIARIFTKYKYQWIVAIKRFSLARNQIIKEREKLLAGICRNFKILILICKYQPGESWVELSSC